MEQRKVLILQVTPSGPGGGGGSSTLMSSAMEGYDVLPVRHPYSPDNSIGSYGSVSLPASCFPQVPLAVVSGLTGTTQLTTLG